MRNEKKIRERKVKNTSLANPATPANFVNRATQWLRLALMQPRKRFIRGVKAESLLLLLIFIFLNNPGFGEARYDWAWDPLDTHDCSKYSHEELAKIQKATDYLRAVMQKGPLTRRHLEIANAIVQGSTSGFNSIRGARGTAPNPVGCDLPPPRPGDNTSPPPNCHIFRVGHRYILFYPACKQVPGLLNEFLAGLNRVRRNCPDPERYARGMVAQIHPFSNGNGRVGVALEQALRELAAGSNCAATRGGPRGPGSNKEGNPLAPVPGGGGPQMMAGGERVIAGFGLACAGNQTAMDGYYSGDPIQYGVGTAATLAGVTVLAGGIQMVAAPLVPISVAAASTSAAAGTVVIGAGGAALVVGTATLCGALGYGLGQYTTGPATGAVMDWWYGNN